MATLTSDSAAAVNAAAAVRFTHDSLALPDARCGCVRSVRVRRCWSATKVAAAGYASGRCLHRCTAAGREIREFCPIIGCRWPNVQQMNVSRDVEQDLEFITNSLRMLP